MAVYTPKVDEVIWTLTQCGWKPSQIRHALEFDQDLNEELGGPVKMPPRTLSEKLRRLRKERGEPKPLEIRPGEERAVIAELRNRILTRAKEELRKLTQKDDTSIEDVRLIAALTKLIDSVDAGIRESQRVKDAQRQDAAKARHQSPKMDLLAEIAKAEEADQAAKAKAQNGRPGK